MKKFFYFLAIFFIFGCNSKSSILPTSQTVKLAITSNNPVEISIDEKLQNRLSGFSIIGDTAYANLNAYASDYNLYREFNILRNSSVKNITFYVNSGGGSVLDFFAVISVIKNNEPYFKMKAIANGVIASMAVPLYLIVPERIACSNTVFMLHPISISERGQFSLMDIETRANLMKIFTKTYSDILLKNSNLTKEKLDEYLLTPGDKYFNVSEAAQMGFVHKVIP